MPHPVAPRPTAVPSLTLAEVARVAGAAYAGPGPNQAVTGVTLDSRDVRPGDLYAALPGAQHHGAAFAAQAAAAGAVALLSDAAGALLAAPVGLPVLEVEQPRRVLGAVAAAVFGRPAERLTALGVTGTSGKTTTAYLLDAGLRAAGHRTGLVGTVETRIADEVLPSSLTTPEAPALQALLAVMVERGCSALTMEVSSHALALGRVDGTTYAVAGFTNLGRDHLDFHRDIEDYFQAKAMLFRPERARRAVVCVDTEGGRRMAEVAQANGLPLTTVSADGHEADWEVSDVAAAPDGSRFLLRLPGGSSSAPLPASVALPGAYNVANALLAVAMLADAGVDPEVAVRGIAAVQVPGRMERVDDAGTGVLGVVDYAHKPDAVVAALTAVRAAVTGRVLAVVGAGGDRDRAKRALMGEAAARLADVVVVTDDNPRSEFPAAIRRAVLDGCAQVPAAQRAQISEVGDRAAAVRSAVGLARAGDAVVVLGKGHERGQTAGGITVPFDDRDELRAALREHAARTASGEVR